MRLPANAARPRHGFTLVEMMVVLFIIVFLATMLVAFGPKLNQQQRAPRGAERLQGWLLVAKQRALRDQAPRGLRFLVSDEDRLAGRIYAREMEYLEQPDDITVTQNVRVATASTIVDLRSGVGEAAAGDFIEFIGEPPPAPPCGHRLVKKRTDLGTNYVELQSTVIPNTYQGYIIHRSAAKPIIGEPSLVMPPGVVVDLMHSNPTHGLTTRSFDIMFSPSGQILRKGTLRYIFWVRDAALTNNQPLQTINMANQFARPSAASYQTAGEQTLITIFSHTGQIGAYQPEPNGTDPYLYTTQGSGSGL